MFKYIDIHCHLQNSHNALDDFKKAEKMGVKSCLCNSCSEKDWESVMTLYERCPQIQCALGIHPWFIDNLEPDWEIRLKKLMEQNPLFIIGEIGLDKNRPNIEKQELIFEKQLNIAHDLKKNVCIHCVDAWEKVLEILNKTKISKSSKLIFHSYNGSTEIMRNILNQYDAFFSYSPMILKDGYLKAKKALTETPCDRILIESDSEQIENVIQVAEKVVSLRGDNDTNLINKIYENSKRALKNG